MFIDKTEWETILEELKNSPHEEVREAALNYTPDNTLKYREKRNTKELAELKAMYTEKMSIPEKAKFEYFMSCYRINRPPKTDYELLFMGKAILCTDIFSDEKKAHKIIDDYEGRQTA